MKAMGIEEFGGRDRMRVMEVDEPLLGPDGVLVRVRAAGVNPVDAEIREGKLAQAFPHWSPIVLGWDAAGVVERVGPAVTDFAAGDEVYGYFRKDYVRDGTYAELVTIRDRHLARKPEAMSFVQAAGVPLAGLAAYQLVDEALTTKADDQVVVLGASGGVGSFVVQLLAERGARVIAVASERNHGYLRELGAERCVDYDADFVGEITGEQAAGVDAVIDLVGGDTQTRSRELLRPGGRLASVISPPPAAGDAGAPEIETRYIFVRPDAGQLRILATMADADDLHVHVSQVLPLEEAARAHELIEGGHTRGKIVLRV